MPVAAVLRFSTRAAVATGILLSAAVASLAHHGWSWTADGLFQLDGVIREIYIGNPHATLDVDVEGEMWRVELAPPGSTIRSGFDENAAKPGDEVTAIGNRSLDENERRMKAVRLVVGGRTYDVYPNRVPPA